MAQSRKRLKLDSAKQIADSLNQSALSLISLLNDSQSSDEGSIANVQRQAREFRLEASQTGRRQGNNSKRKGPALTISFCKMERSRKGGLKKYEDYVEVALSGEEDYDLCVQKALTSLKIEYDDEVYEPYICRTSGCKILNQPVIVDGRELPWTILRYVRSVFRKTTTSIKLGIALLEKPPDDTPNVERSPSDVEQLQILYAPKFNVGELGLDMQVVKTREEVWKGVSNLPVSKMDTPIPFYPETAGYEVCRITRGDVDLLSYDGDGFQVLNDKDKFSVIHQSSDTLISMHMGDSVVPLFCVASKHCSSYQYNWDNLHGNVGQLSPVLYANKVGIYRCTITHGLEGLSASKCYSKSISVNEAPVTRSESGPDYSRQPSPTTNEGTSSSPTTQQDTSLSAIGTSPAHSTKRDTLLSTDVPPKVKRDSGVRRFTKSEIEQATSSFKDLIGMGGFGKVYRGSFHGLEVAVKVFHEEGKIDTDTSLHTEVNNLSRFRHPNLITLMGYCDDLKALIYPYMEKLSLFHCLHRFKVEDPLSWERRIHILKGTACGLTYLHSSDPPFIHQDIKSHNILLDNSFTAKVCDFGFVTAIDTKVGSTNVVTAVGTIGLAGTRGYTAPEYTDGKRGPKSDVYSYGVLCLETYTGLLPYSEERDEEKLVDHCQEEGMWREVMKFRAMADLKAGIPSEVLATTFFNITLKCLHKNHKKRCTMDEALSMWSDLSIK